ncbi:MAG: GNAT family N-acetyltransferase [Clostridiales bacterium]|jgi:RimJ/RimL family protein N-acetyltransferase|nr:GNAT family N-acetyltransferase [Clostridiales bacterium]
MLAAFCYEHAAALAAIISTDKKLHDRLSSQPMDPVTAVAFYEKTAAWIEKKRSQTYTILLAGSPVGLISLVPKTTATAEVGMWVGSAYWRHGVGSGALTELFGRAKSDGIRTVTCKIEAVNEASLGMCKKLGGTVMPYDETKVAVRFELSNEPVGGASFFLATNASVALAFCGHTCYTK